MTPLPVKKPNAEPRNWLVPDLVTALMTAPDARPYSASNWLVMIWTSWIDSFAARVWPPTFDPRCSSVLLAPSKMMLLAAVGWPLAWKLSFRNSPLGTKIVPGTLPTNAM